MTDLLSSFYLAQVLPLFILSLISSTILLTKLRKIILQAIFFATGLSLFIIRPLIMSSYQEVTLETFYITEFIDLGVAPALIISSIISQKLTRSEDLYKNKISILMTTISLIAIPLLYLYLYSRNFDLVFKMLLISVANWIIWHSLTDLLALIYIKGYIRRGFIIVIHSRPIPKEESFVDYIFKIFTLVFYSFSITTFIFSIITVELEELEFAVLLARTSWISLLFSSVFLIPVKWLLDYIDIRAYSKENFSLEDVRIWGVIEEFAGITALASFIILMYQLAESIGVTMAWRTAYTLTLIILMAEVPTVALPILLYKLFSIERHKDFVFRVVRPIPISSLSELETITGGKA